ncbi:MAG: P-loop NTPase [Bacteroidales bacterium]
MRIAFASGKGGTGKTFVSTNVFNILLERGIKTNIVDCDAEVPNVCIFFDAKEKNKWPVNEYRPEIDIDKCVFCGKCVEYCNYHALFYIPSSKILKVMEDTCHGCSACRYACEYGAITDSYKKVGEVTHFEYSELGNIFEGRMRIHSMATVIVLKDAIKHSKNTDCEISLFDAPPGTSCPFIQTSLRADFVIFVAEPTPFGISDLRQSIETLKGMNIKCGVIINRSDLGNDALEKYLYSENIPIIAKIPFSKEFAKYYTAGKIASQYSEEAHKTFDKITDFVINKNKELKAKETSK